MSKQMPENLLTASSKLLAVSNWLLSRISNGEGAQHSGQLLPCFPHGNSSCPYEIVICMLPKDKSLVYITVLPLGRK